MQDKPTITHIATTRYFTQSTGAVVLSFDPVYITSDLGVRDSGRPSLAGVSTGSPLQTPVRRGPVDDSRRKQGDSNVKKSHTLATFLQLVLQAKGMSVTSPSIRCRTFCPLMGKSGSEYSAAARSP